MRHSLSAVLPVLLSFFQILKFAMICACRAIGEYAEQGGTKDAKKLVDGFFLAVQGFDYTLFQAKRNETPVKEDSDKALAKTIEALDK